MKSDAEFEREKYAQDWDEAHIINLGLIHDKAIKTNNAIDRIKLDEETLRAELVKKDKVSILNLSNASKVFLAKNTWQEYETQEAIVIVGNYIDQIEALRVKLFEDCENLK